MNGSGATITHLTTFPHSSGHQVRLLGIKEPQGAKGEPSSDPQRGPTPPEAGVPGLRENEAGNV